jgi:hypothetical protein
MVDVEGRRSLIPRHRQRSSPLIFLKDKFLWGGAVFPKKTTIVALPFCPTAR